MSQQDVVIVRGALEALGRGDMDGFLAAYDPAVEARVPPSLPWGGVHRGHHGIRQLIAGIAQAFEPGVEIGLEDILDAGPVVVPVVRLRGRGRASGCEVDMRVVELFRLQAGLVVDIDVFYKDTAALLEALAAS